MYTNNFLRCISAMTLAVMVSSGNLFAQQEITIAAKMPAVSVKMSLQKATRAPITNPGMELIRQRIIDDLLAPAVNVKSIQQLITTIQPDGSWPGINYVDTSRTGFQHREHLEHMLDLAQAHAKKGSPYFQNMQVKKVALSALDFWLAHDFICQNWWWNEMGTPNFMINTLLLLDTALSENQRMAGLKIAGRASLEGFGARPGGDLIQIAGMLGKQGLFKRDEQVMERVIKTMADEIKISTGRGLQPDMSFHHRTDRVMSTLTYGTGYVSSFAYWAVKIAGTQYTLPETALQQLIDYYLDGISKSMAFGRFPDLGAKNRDLTRKGTLSPASAEIPVNLLKASTGYRKAELEHLVNIRNGKQPPNLQWNKYFWHSGYFSHQRPTWFSSVRMHSSRQNNMEEPHNEEGLKNHHFADGANFITLTGKEYVDVFPVWDWQKIPGATIIQKPSVLPFNQIAKKGRTAFVGGVSNGNYGAAATDFSSVHDPLTARKSWFFFRDEYVCLGAGITATSEYPVVTTLNQCNLEGTVQVGNATGMKSLTRGTHELQEVRWIHHNNVAYLFPELNTVQLQNTTATGNWREINHQDWATTEPVKKDLFTAWLPHGVSPNNAGYSYIVVPAIKAAAINQYQQKKAISILSNTPTLQAVRHGALQLTQVVFYQPGNIGLGKQLTLTANQPCMVMIEMEGNKIKKITVADPTQSLTALQFSITAPVTIKGANGKAEWMEAGKLSLVTIDLPPGGDAGKSISLVFE